MCFFMLVAMVTKAQDVTALWDFQNRVPASLADVALLGTTGEVESTVDGVKLYVDATNGKFNVKDRASDAQVNPGTIIRVPVKSAKDIVTVTSYPNYHNYTVGGIEATADVTEHKATTDEVSAGYVDIVVTGSCYLYNIKVQFVSNIQTKELYSTDFSEWTYVKASAVETEVHNATTKYSHENIAFSVYNTNVAPNPDEIGIDWSKFDKDLVGGTLQAEKNGGSYIVTSALASVTKVTFVHGATGGNRGWSLWAKGDGDADWVQITTTAASPAGWCEVSADVNRTNCQLKFTNLADAQNAYLFRLGIYGSVDMSLTPALGSFSYNGEKYNAADIFAESEEGLQTATIEVANATPLPSAENPVTDIVCDNGELDGDVIYETVGETSVVTMKVKANDDVMTYKVTFVHKPYFTLTYYNVDGSVLENSQKVEKDAKIATLRNDEGVTVAEGKKFRGWYVEADGGRKYSVDDVVTSDLNLYAGVTDIETESTSARYTFNLTDEYFYDEDHEAFNAENAGFHDSTHGWTLESNGKIDLLVGGHAYIIATLCRYSKQDATLTLYDAEGNEVSTVPGYDSTDGKSVMLEYKGAAGTVTLKSSNEVYLHKLVIANVEGSPIEKNEQGYYVVKANDGGNFLTTLEIANATSSSDKRTYVFVPDGTYDLGNAVLTPISGNNISIIGQSMDNTIIVNEAEQEGIGVSATLYITGQNTYLQDLTLKNAYDYYKPGFAGRAVVIQDKGSHTICKNVRMLSYQDTYYSNSDSHFYFENSDIHGTVDFICGEGDVFFNNCTLTVEPRNADGSGECTLTAPSTNNTKYGYVFSGCTIDSKAEKFNYGRAWNNTPRCAYINTTLLQPEKLNSNRWTLGGMNVPADKFVEYNTMDASGKVISPSSYVCTFTKDSKKNTYETILTVDEADTYSLDNLSKAWNWYPATYTAQKSMNLLKADGNKLTWDAVDGALAYAVFRNGTFVGMTTTESYDITEGTASEYIVRAANECGGFGQGASMTTAISDTFADNADIMQTSYYNVQGVRVNNSYKGIVIKVDTLKDGKKVATKIMR
ncbi:pectinesterase family protein [uncultured Prevotella sp.]|uniref:pectinesterase family protein n=1 Tax=uncultured Prevotella sp. TaxID=159272 RepID=UPI0025F074B7|nr:pectinesterase family protein [uncultured Prevotella sp.]